MKTMKMGKEYRKYRKLWDELPKEEKVTQFPLHLDIELTSKCNLNCPICPYHSKDAPFPVEPANMNIFLFRKIIDEGSEKGLKSIKLNFSGEPLLYPLLTQAIEYAKQKKILDIMINTNGTLLTNNLCHELINAGLDLIIITDLNLPIQKMNVIMLKTIRDLHGRKNPKIRIKTFKSENWENIADEITEPEVYDYHNLENDYRKSSYKCYQPWVRLLILVDGTICRCSCGTLMNDKIIGNVHSSSIEELWNSEYMNYLRFCHSNKVSELVQSCLCCPGRTVFINKEKGGNNEK